MARLYSDLIDGSGRRYYFGLNSAAGGITNANPASLTLFGYLPVFQERSEIFRNPATAMLTLNGQLASAEPHLQPATAGLAYQGKIAGLMTLRVITNAMPPDYTALPDNAPTIIYIATVTPAPAALTMLSLEHNITQGGNIGFLSPGKATLTMGGFDAQFPRFADVGTLTINGLAATLLTELSITPDAGYLSVGGFPASLSTPFLWVDDDRPTPPTWLDD